MRRRNQRRDIRDDSYFLRKKLNINALVVGIPRVLRKLTLQPEREVYAYGTSMHSDVYVCTRVYAYACTRSFPSHRALIMVKAAGSTSYPSSDIFCLTYNGNMRGVTFVLWKISFSTRCCLSVCYFSKYRNIIPSSKFKIICLDPSAQ